jgi:tRNA-Thr(GGU) m(6)t(6)A37 methyltransferase TsaA
MRPPIPPKSYTSGATFPTQIELRPIGIVHAPHKERHGTPRQAAVPADPALRPDERATIELFDDVCGPDALVDLAGFDYVWVLSWLHLNDHARTGPKSWRDRVTPPGETDAKSLFATRAPHRPNPIGLSAVRIVGVEGLHVHLERIDLLDGTPVLDLKPYVPYADAFADARAGWLDVRGVPNG